MRPLGVVVAAGGDARRFEANKLTALVDGRPLLDHTLGSVPTRAVVVCVGPELPTVRQVSWTREEPSGAGPLAAVAAGLAALPPDLDPVALVGGDMPYAGRALPSLRFALAAATAAARANPPGRRETPDAAVALSADGYRQPLLSVWRRDRLGQRLIELGALASRPLRDLLGLAALVELPLPVSATWDVDTPADLVGPPAVRPGPAASG